MNKRTGLRVVSLLIVGFTSQAMAQTPALEPVSPWYIGFGGMRSDGTIPSQTVDGIDGLFAGALGSTSTVREVDDRFTGWKLYVGYEFNPYLAVEVGGTSMGTTSVAYDFRTGTPSASVGTLLMQYHLSAGYVDAVGKWPLSEKWALIGRIGASVGETRVEFEGSPLTLLLGSDERDETEVRPHFGGGTQYWITPSAALRFEYERFEMPDPLSDEQVKVDTLSASIQFRF